MTVRAARRLTLAFFIAFVVVQTYPGALPFHRPRPFVLGLPFPFFWAALWVALSALVFWVLDRAEVRAERRAEPEE